MSDEPAIRKSKRAKSTSDSPLLGHQEQIPAEVKSHQLEILKIGPLKKGYPIADRIPEVKKIARSCLFPARVSSAVPKKYRTSILNKRCNKLVCKNMYVTSVQGLVTRKLGSN